MSQPSSVTAENAAAGLHEKSPNWHAHYADDIVGLGEMIDSKEEQLLPEIVFEGHVSVTGKGQVELGTGTVIPEGVYAVHIESSATLPYTSVSLTDERWSSSGGIWNNVSSSATSFIGDNWKAGNSISSGYGLFICGYDRPLNVEVRPSEMSKTTLVLAASRNLASSSAEVSKVDYSVRMRRIF